MRYELLSEMVLHHVYSQGLDRIIVLSHSAGITKSFAYLIFTICQYMVRIDLTLTVIIWVVEMYEAIYSFFHSGVINGCH